ncbi:MAG: Nif3-like dinuclear metal center hexameric protein [Thermodesulfobacteriota bacterium]|nr:Nif3-like dinuclear metal center hexameric protein [Thermodesulfobacteriota bacterium]
MTAVKDILALIERLAPARLTAQWDNCGLMVGRPEVPIRKAALALDPTLYTIQAAHDLGAQLLLTHHPLIFSPLKSLNLDKEPAAVAALALKLGLAIVSAHTNLDAAADGVSWALARRLGLQDIQTLERMTGADKFKLTVFVPLGYEGQVRTALFQAGAGRIGAYTGCSFSGRGEGTFTPEKGAKPFMGQTGQAERVSESRLEVLVETEVLDEVIAALTKAHPYEEAAYDVYRLASLSGREGFGCLGNLNKKLNIEDLVEQVKTKLEVDIVRVAAMRPGPIEKVAVMGGSGGSMVGLAKSRGAEVLITGDIGYHQAREAEYLSLCVIDAGHFATERPVLMELAERLTALARKEGLAVDFEVLTGENDPWTLMEG